MKKISFGVILLGLFALGCEQKIEAPKGSEPTFTVQQGDTLVRTQVNTPLIKAVFVDNQGGHTVSRAVITVTGDNGFKLADMKDLALTISSNAGGQAQYGFATLQSQQSVDLNFVLGTGQTLDIDVSAYNDLAHNARVKIGLEIFYTGPSGTRSIKREGPFIRAEKSGVVFKVEDPLPLRTVLTSEKVVLLNFSLKGEGVPQRFIEMECQYSGTLGYRSIQTLSLVNKQGVKIAEEASNPTGKFYFDNISDNLSTEKEYSLVANLDMNQTGDRFTVKILSITTEEMMTGDETVTTFPVPIEGGHVVAYNSLVEVKTNQLASIVLANGERTLASHIFTAKGGVAAVLQLKKNIVIADNGADSMITISNLKVRINGTVVPKEFVFFSKPNGDTTSVYGENDTHLFITLVGGRNIPKDGNLVVELLGTIKGIGGPGDAIATTLEVDDPLDLVRRHVTRAQGQHLAGLHNSSGISSNRIPYSLILSDKASFNHSGIFGISSDDWRNGYSIDKKNLFASVLQ